MNRISRSDLARIGDAGSLPISWAGVQRLLLVGAGCAGALFVGYHVGTGQFSFRSLIVAFIVLAVASALLSGRQGLSIGFLLWVCILAIGYRTIPVTAHIKLVPAELLLLGLMAFLMARSVITPAERKAFRLPLWIVLLMPFCLWGWVPGLYAGRPWDLMFAEFLNFLTLIPLYAVAAAVLKESRWWPRVLLAAVIVATWIAVWGAVEYLFPSVTKLFPSFISSTEVLISADGFARARFSFWGHPAATFICALFLPLNLVVWRVWPSHWQRAVLLLAVTVQLYAIYIGGYRSMWLLTGIVVSIWLVYRVGLLRGPAFVVPFLAAVQLMPAATQDHIESLVLTLEGRPIDSSAEKRWDRAMTAIDQIWQSPHGLGWGGAGWVHSDFIQFAANVGLIAGLIFAAAYAVTLWRLWRQVHQLPRHERSTSISLALLLAFIVAGGLLAMQGVQVLPQLILPVWLIWVLCEIWLRQQRAVITSGTQL